MSAYTNTMGTNIEHVTCLHGVHDAHENFKEHACGRYHSETFTRMTGTKYSAEISKNKILPKNLACTTLNCLAVTLYQNLLLSHNFSPQKQMQDFAGIDEAIYISGT